MKTSMAEDYTQHDMADYQIWVVRSIRQWIAWGSDKDQIWLKGTRASFQSRLSLAGLTLAEAYQAAGATITIVTESRFVALLMEQPGEGS